METRNAAVRIVHRVLVAFRSIGEVSGHNIPHDVSSGRLVRILGLCGGSCEPADSVVLCGLSGQLNVVRRALASRDHAEGLVQIRDDSFDFFIGEDGVGAEANTLSGRHFPTCLWKISERVFGNDQFPFSLHVVKVFGNLCHVVGGLAVVLPTGRGLFAVPAAVSFIHHEVGGAIRFDRLCGLKDHVLPCGRLLDHVQHVRTGRGIGLLPAAEIVERRGVDFLGAVVGIEDKVLRPVLLEVVRGKVESPAANVDVGFAEFHVRVLEKRRDLLDGGLRRGDVLGNRVYSLTSRKASSIRSSSVAFQFASI